MADGRSLAAAVCAGLSVLALAAGGILLYLRIEVLDEDRFADRAIVAIQDPQVRAVIADRIVAEAIDAQPDLQAARPVLESAVSGALDTRAFENLARIAIRNAHRLLFDRDEPTLAVDVADAAQLIVPAVRSVDPELAEELPRRIEAPLATLDRRSFATDTLELADRVRALAIVLPLLAIALLAAAVWLSASRAAAVRRAPLAIAAAAAIVLLVVLLAEPDATARVKGLTLNQADAAVDDVWEALAAPLRDWAIAIGLTALAVTVLLSPGAARLARPVLAAGRAIAAPPPSSGIRALRGVALGVAGLLVVTAPSDVVRVVGVVIGALLLAAGAAELLAAATPGAEPLSRRGRRRLAVPVAATVLAVAAGATLWIVLRDGDGLAGAVQSADAAGTCNGMRELCDRHLNAIVFPGTHNSMSASDEPGWLIANQRRSIPQQLDDGIRLFLIDTHWGVEASNGRIRTDLQAEGSSRNKVAKQLGPEAVQTAERLTGRIGVGDMEGEREVYLCHTLCELGATRMSGTLDYVRGWLDRHPRQLIVLFIEPSTPAWSVVDEMRRADLLDRIATLREDFVLPTLGQLLDDGKQIVVLGERLTGNVPWYLDGFSWVQDTPLGKQSATSCAESRGDPDSPIFMINHWADVFPPRASANARINSRADIVERVQRCQRARGLLPAFVAVDHYELGDVVGAAEVLNAKSQ
jgi:hypothetical protein